MADHSHLPLLSANGQRLINKLLELPRTWISAATLATSIGISRRTVLRELDSIEKWMSTAGFSFLRSPGKGLMLDEDDTGRAELRCLLEKTSNDHYLTREQRRQRLLEALFNAEEPVKTYALAHDLSVSERTLKEDLDYLEQWLLPYHVLLRRRPGVGIWLDGAPDDRRRALRSLLQASIPAKELQNLLHGIAPQSGMLTFLLGPEQTNKALALLCQFAEEENCQFTDTGFLYLALHLLLTIKQLQKGTHCPSEPSYSQGNQEQALRLAKRLSEAFSITLPSSEIQYLANCLSTFRSDSLQQNWDSPDEWEFRHVAVLLTTAVAMEMNVDLSHYPTLANDLCCHLRPMFHRIRQGTTAENPQLELIQQQYPRIWEATRTACNLVQEQLALPFIPDEEAGFLAMHFGAVIEADSLMKLRLRAVVVCPYGMASCRFLIAQLIREFPVLHISRSCSVRELNAEKLSKEGIDLILSTIPLEINFPHLCINTILQEQDKVLLREMIDRLQQLPPSPAQSQAGQVQSLQHAARKNEGILELLHTLAIETVPVPKTRSSLIESAAKLFCPLNTDQHSVEEKLFRREELGDTYIKPLRVLLLHCKTNAVSGCRLGYLKAEPPVYEGSKMILGALVLLVPENDDARLEVIQAVSALLIEEPALMNAFRSGSLSKAAAILESGLIHRLQ